MWPWKRVKERVKERVEEPTDAEIALEKAQHDLADVHRKWPEVNRVAASLREVRERNHFAERIEHLIRGGI